MVKRQALDQWKRHSATESVQSAHNKHAFLHTDPTSKACRKHHLSAHVLPVHK